MKRHLALLTVGLALTGCASGSGRFGRVSEARVTFPAPPDTARIQFLLSVSNEDDVKGVQDEGWLASVLADPGEPNEGIVKPYGVAHNDGRLYVCDTMLPGVEIIDIRARSFRRWNPSGEGALRKPINCTVDPATDRLYVADTERSQVVVFGADLEYLTAFGGSEGTATDVFVDDAHVLVTDIRSGQVHLYDKTTYALVRSFPEEGVEGDADLRQPTNLWVHGDRVIVSDFGDFGVKLYSKDGTFHKRIGTFGRGLGQFVRPKGVSTDNDGNIYVVDAGFENVQVFTPDGQLLTFFGGSYAGPGTMWLPAQVHVSYQDLELFEGYVDPEFTLDYVILVTNQYGPDRLNVYGFVSPADGPG
jgi:DNA-binding beta-propeller fold protein YncE